MTYARQIWDTLRSYLGGPFIKSSQMERWFAEMTGATTITAPTPPVNEDTALALSAVWNAVTLIAGTVGSLPLILYKRTADGDREVMRHHPLYTILHDEPNPDMSSMDFRETMQGHVLNWGNAFAEITRNGAGQVAALSPIFPSRVSLHRDTRGLYYEVNNAPESPVRIEARNMLHLKGWSPDGIWGHSVIGKARESLGYSVNSERYGSAFYANATIHGGVVKHPGRLSDQAHARLLKDIEARHKGGANAFKLAILEEGMTWDRMGIPPVDAQFLESRTFQILEICRWYNIQPHKLKELTHATFTNIEHQSLEFVQDTLRPWLLKWEGEMNRKLIAPLERKIQYIEHNVEGLLRGDTESRYRAYATAKDHGWMNANTICQKENLPRLPGDDGEMYLVMSNMVPVARAGLGLQPEVGEPGVGGSPPPAPATIEEEDPVEAETGRAVFLPDPRRRAQVITAHRMLIADVVRRHLAREKDKARTAATHGPERVRLWIGEFYGGPFGEAFRRALLPVVQMHLALTGTEADPAAITRDLVEAHVAESRRHLWTLLEHPPEDLRAAVETLMTRWDIERVTTIPDKLLVEELTHG